MNTSLGNPRPFNINLPGLKLERAGEQAVALKYELDAYYQDWGPPVRMDLEQRSEGLSHYAFVMQTPKPLPRHWPVLIGEIVYNLRSALEHVANELARANLGTDKAPSRTGFPIHKSAGRKGWASDRDSSGPHQTRGMSDAHKKIIRDAQPFNAPDPLVHPLWLLKGMSDHDKHDSMHVVNVLFQEGKLKLAVAEGVEPGPLDVLPAPYREGDVLARFTAPVTDKSDDGILGLETNMLPALRFASSAPAAGMDVQDVIGGMLQTVCDVFMAIRGAGPPLS